MTREEQNVFLSEGYREALRYMDNAKEALQKSQKDDHYYKDSKYVKAACGIAYSGVLVALDAWFQLKEVTSPRKSLRKSVDFYKGNIYKLDKKMSDRFNTAYEVLHLVGYYDGERRIKTIQSGFEVAYEIIERIKPEELVEVKESRVKEAKRILNGLFILFSTTVKRG